MDLGLWLSSMPWLRPFSTHSIQADVTARCLPEAEAALGHLKSGPQRQMKSPRKVRLPGSQGHIPTTRRASFETSPTIPPPGASAAKPKRRRIAHDASPHPGLVLGCQSPNHPVAATQEHNLESFKELPTETFPKEKYPKRQFESTPPREPRTAEVPWSDDAELDHLRQLNTELCLSGVEWLMEGVGTFQVFVGPSPDHAPQKRLLQEASEMLHSRVLPDAPQQWNSTPFSSMPLAFASSGGGDPAAVRSLLPLRIGRQQGSAETDELGPLVVDFGVEGVFYVDVDAIRGAQAMPGENGEDCRSNSQTANCLGAIFHFPGVSLSISFPPGGEGMCPSSHSFGAGSRPTQESAADHSDRRQELQEHFIRYCVVLDDMAKAKATGERIKSRTWKGGGLQIAKTDEWAQACVRLSTVAVAAAEVSEGDPCLLSFLLNSAMEQFSSAAEGIEYEQSSKIP